MAELSYRPWRQGDDQLLIQLWGDPEGPAAAQFRGALAPDADPVAHDGGRHDGGRPDGGRPDGVGGHAPASGVWRRCVVAEDEGIPVAAGVVFSSALHPERLWAYVEVARDHRRRGVGTEILRRLREAAAAAPSSGTAGDGTASNGTAGNGTAGGARLRSKVPAGSAGEAFAAARGFGVLQRSRQVVVSPGALRLPVLGDGTDAGDTKPLVEDLATGSVELSDAVGRYYTAVHAWDPPAPLSVGRAQQLFLSDAAGAHGAVVLREPAASAFGTGVFPSKKGRLRAFAVSYAGPSAAAGEEPSEVMLGHEVRLGGGEAEDAVRGLLALIAYQHPVRLEVDDSMAALAAVVAPLLADGRAWQAGPETLVVGD
ncbi:GNAT family N-acetyltransferase [Sinomonas mesophila]|uniref:GNAT family N-acetyltransferase n=1 Tax=Sinomonas mesophila TaxID=1531955 RepID=UPI000984A633|nr:GNAT family N-acetyltransferase [Sinomonas mesophila]